MSHHPLFRAAAALTLFAALPLPAFAAPKLDAAPAAAPADPAQQESAAVALGKAALEDQQAWAFTRDLTTDVGPRQAGTEAERRARNWAAARLAQSGFANVKIEPFMMPTWVRGAESGALTAPYPFRLALTALGNSAATPAGGLSGELAVFPDLATFEAAPDALVRGRIIYIGHQMRRTQDGSSYGAFGPVRRAGPAKASQRGAAALLIRSLGTDQHRNPHTGSSTFPEGVAPIPAAALSNPDADQIEALAAKGPVSVQLTLTPQNIGQQASGNVVAEFPGSDPAAGIVLAACHLDSWDLGTGAIDDAVGCGIVTAAAARVAAAAKPRRTIRVLLAGAEEVGVWGGKTYLAGHGAERHAVALESDFGADRVWRVDFKLPDSARAVSDRIARALTPLGITRGEGAASGGADIEPLITQRSVPVIDLQQDGTRYFDLHHTPDDTLDKIDKAQLQQNVAAWTTTLYLLANAPESLGESQP